MGLKMSKLKIIMVSAILIATSGCGSFDTSGLFSSNAPAPQYEYIIAPNSDGEVVGLQNLLTREVVYCYNGEATSKEECATLFEEKGYTRFRDIPYKTANFDELKVDTYPTRRWRDSEITSRW